MLKWALWTLLSETENSDIKVSSVNSNDDNEWGNNSFYTWVEDYWNVAKIFLLSGELVGNRMTEFLHSVSKSDKATIVFNAFHTLLKVSDNVQESIFMHSFQFLFDEPYCLP